MTPAGCPKEMVHGPCGGVRPDLGCEVDGRPCPFVGPGERARFDAPPAGVAGTRADGSRTDEPLLVVDVRAPTGWPGDVRALWTRAAQVLQGTVPLLGEHVDNPTGHDDAGPVSPLEVVSILRDGGAPPIFTVTGRDRSLDEARALMGRARDAGARAVHCVTGDHPRALGIERTTRFGAESMSLLAAARSVGVAASVAESPASPGPRAARLAAKARAGAALCIWNHCGDVGDLVRFSDDARAAGATLPIVAPVAMVADSASAYGLVAFPGLTLPEGHLAAIQQATDPLTCSLGLVTDFVRELAATGRFVGVNLSGGTTRTDPWHRLELTERFVSCVRAAWAEGCVAPTGR